MSSPEHSQNTETSGCVVVIDDHADVRQLLACALEIAGFEVVKVGTELELQRLLVDIRPDALVIDLQDSPADGLHVLGRLRGRPTLRQVPIVFLASSDAEHIRERALRAGADWFAERPLSMIELQNRTVELVRQRRPPATLARTHKRVS